MHHSLSRRGLFGLGAAAAVAVAGGCSASGGAARPAAGDQPWEHTLSNGHRTALDHFPERVVVDTFGLGAMWPYGIRPAGYWGYLPEDRTTVGVDDLSTMTNVGADAEFNLEKVAELGTDLLIGYSSDGVGWPWWPNTDVAAQATKMAPFMPIVWGKLGTVELIEEFRLLAKSLGGDVESTQVAADKKLFDDNVARLRTLTAAKPLKVLPLQANVDGLYIGVNLQVLDFLSELGVNLVKAEPTKPDGPWASISWEQISGYDADLILDFEMSDAAAHESPVWKRLPAVEAGQLGEWNDKRANHYGNYGAWLGQLADAYDKAQPVT
ncbi:ABC transporter substrate-binding protein [Propionibacteriaceae bacterium Y1685]|uniref:ABC transporter substrate-binding protein n=1 Tax=Microlunatus sp. Y1700 TaxID=3418487 RepID=UPI003B776871